ncbi:hypothetical protein Aduo_019266 [Ancylostoma duodenale]
MNLPVEIIVDILARLQPSDITNCQRVSKKLRGIVTRNAKYLPRKPVSVRIFQKSGVTYIWHSENNAKVEDFSHFDANKWNLVAVESLTFENISSSNLQTHCILQTVAIALKKTRQRHVRAFTMDSVNIDGLSQYHLSEIFRFVSATCEQILVNHCNLPVAPSPEHLLRCRGLIHYRWLDSRSTSVDRTNDAVLRRYTRDVRECTEKRSFLGEMDCATASTVCDFIQAWSASVTAPYFNITLGGCDEEWRSSFNDECARRNIYNICMEFASNVIATAHIKVVFVKEAQLCRMWPIFDIPARNAPGICYSRFYRDF